MGTVFQQDLCQLLKIVFEQVFPKIHAGGLEKAILEVIQIPHHRASIKLRQRVADTEIEITGSGILNIGQQGDGLVQQLFFVVTEHAGQPATLDGIE